MKCHAKYNTADIMANLDNEPDPHCHRKLPYSGNMPCNGLIKTDVVYFGEALPDGAIEKSYRLAAQADRETERAFQTMIRQQRGKEDADGGKPPEVCGG